jgi:3-hydroxyisobutyrate dehydrogenase-like beta-hydroxyacid dehydrogenase
MKIGFIGSEHMGAGMAASLLKAGHEVSLCNRTRKKADKFVARGAKAVATVSDACRSDAVITMLGNDNAVESIVFGEDGIIHKRLERARHISLSATSVALSERLAAAHAQAGQRLITAPVFRRPDAAAEGKLFVVAGTPDAIEAAAASLFAAIGQKNFIVSDRPQAAKSREAQRQFSDRFSHRVSRRGHGACPQGWRQPAGISRHSDRDAVHRPRV